MINVVVIDDSEIFRVGIAAYLKTKGIVTAITEMEYCKEKIISTVNSATDVVILDPEHRCNYDFEIIRRLRRKFQALNLIIFTHERNSDLDILARKFGADYFLTKEHQHLKLLKIIENINNNNRGKI